MMQGQLEIRRLEIHGKYMLDATITTLPAQERRSQAEQQHGHVCKRNLEMVGVVFKELRGQLHGRSRYRNSGKTWRFLRTDLGENGWDSIK